MLGNKGLIETQIRQDWGQNPQSEICIAVLNYLLHEPTDNLFHITYGSLRIVVSHKYTDIEILKAIQYLCGDKVNLLEPNFEIIDNDKTSYPISNDELSIAEETGELVHPQTGELINNFKEKLFIYFKPSSLVKNISK